MLSCVLLIILISLSLEGKYMTFQNWYKMTVQRKSQEILKLQFYSAQLRLCLTSMYDIYLNPEFYMGHLGDTLWEKVMYSLVNFGIKLKSNLYVFSGYISSMVRSNWLPPSQLSRVLNSEDSNLNETLPMFCFFLERKDI